MNEEIKAEAFRLTDLLKYLDIIHDELFSKIRNNDKAYNYMFMNDESYKEEFESALNLRKALRYIDAAEILIRHEMENKLYE